MKKAAIVILAVALVGGCSGMSTTQQRTLSGGAIGAGGGTLIGWAAGCPACGAATAGDGRRTDHPVRRPFLDGL